MWTSGTSNASFANSVSTPPSVQDSPTLAELARDCKLAVNEVRASRKVIADQEAKISNLEARVVELEKLDANNEAQKANLREQIASLRAQLTVEKQILETERERLANHERERERLQKALDAANSAKTRNLIIGILLGIAAGVGIAAGR